MNDRTDVDGIHNMINMEDISSNAPLEDIEQQISEGFSFLPKNNQELSIPQHFDNLLNDNEDYDNYSHNRGDRDNRDNRSNSGGFAMHNSRASSPAPSFMSVKSHDERTPNTYDPFNNEMDRMRDNRSERGTRSPTRDFNAETMEERQSRALNLFIDSNNDGEKRDNYDLSHERMDDEKLMMIEQIEELKVNLELEDTDVSRFKVDENDSFDTIKKIHTKLKLKSQYKSYSGMFEHSVILGAECVEWAFDGRKDYFGYTPDMTGWSETVQVRLQRMKLETASFVSGIMQEYKMSSGLNIFFQLVLSGVMHSVAKNKENQDAALATGSSDAPELNREWRTAMRGMDD